MIDAKKRISFDFICIYKIQLVVACDAIVITLILIHTILLLIILSFTDRIFQEKLP